MNNFLRIIKNITGMFHVLRGRHEKSLSIAGVGFDVPCSEWKIWALYRLRMYAPIIAYWEKKKRINPRYFEALIVAHAALGRVQEAEEFLQEQNISLLAIKKRMSLAKSLAPYMPAVAYDVLSKAGKAASPGLKASLLLQLGEKEQALEIINACKADKSFEKDPDLILLQMAAMKLAPSKQMEFLNEYLKNFGLCELRLKDENNPIASGNVELAANLDDCDGPLISILMTTYCSGERVDVAIDSLLKQTYRNIEIIVVDDASNDTTVERVRAWECRDRRVRLICLPRNGGTYLAKSIGLMHARGEFVTCHDSDDWSHPLKIERQARPLLENSQLIATTSSWLRVSDDGAFYARLVYPLLRFNPSSILFRRKEVLERMGAPWDIVRTGADSEFHARLKLVFGKKAIGDIRQPLALGAHRPGSLMTAQDTGYSDGGGATHRLTYLEAWEKWHIQCLQNGSLPMLPLDMVEMVEKRQFPAPDAIKVPAETVRVALAACKK